MFGYVSSDRSTLQNLESLNVETDPGKADQTMWSHQLMKIVAYVHISYKYAVSHNQSYSAIFSNRPNIYI